MLLGTNAIAHDASLRSFSQSAASDTVGAPSGTVVHLPLLVIVTSKGQVRDIQHSQRLPDNVNKLLWKSVQAWVKSPAHVNGRRVNAQVFMDAALHAEPQADGKSSVYFTLASLGPVMRGYWKMHGDRINGPCSTVTGNMSAGFGGTSSRCTFKITAGVAPMATGVSSTQ
ncbi:hypothetical protein [Rhodanobacter sp. L36]|uniref:hypothetical protein n=1 Tax=Rhodanobacter sp. L36 TaxID=1747221 RepID=UPI00131E263E|nr:hypothetical protein [Rhodanobacter sp. L36]